jgi:hypothetical protein
MVPADSVVEVAAVGEAVVVPVTVSILNICTFIIVIILTSKIPHLII